MNQRERFLATAQFQPVDRTFLLNPWLWTQTLTRWQAEGLAKDTNLAEYFGTDCERDAPIAAQGRYGPHLHPGLERTVLSESGDHLIVRDEEGNTVKLFKDDPLQSMPEWVEYPMKDRQDWETIVKPRTDASIPGRFPPEEQWRQYVESVQTREFPLGFWCGSFYGWPRSFLGVERVSVMFYDDPVLIHEMCNHIADFAIELFTPVLKEIQFDYAISSQI